MNIFLRMKHWQLFLLVVGLPLFLEFLMFASMIVTRDAQMFTWYLPVIAVAGLLSWGSMFVWFYTLGINLFKRLPATVKMNLTTFKIFLFTPVAYILLICLIIAGAFFLGVFKEDGPSPAFLLLFIPIHLFAMFCIFYCMYFISKSLKAVEWQRPVTAGDYIGEFLLIWFYFVGIWFIQPRINRIFYPPAFTEFPESLAS